MRRRIRTTSSAQSAIYSAYVHADHLTLEFDAMADSVLQSLSASSLFDLRGVVAVVTGGGTVRQLQSELQTNETC